MPKKTYLFEKIPVLDIGANKRSVYVSCNVATQARDLALMSHAYRLAKINA